MQTTFSRYEIKSPYFVLNDAPLKAEHTMEEARAAAYFNDVYHIFLTRLTKFIMEGQTSDADYKKLISYFKEVIDLRRKDEGKQPDPSLWA